MGHLYVYIIIIYNYNQSQLGWLPGNQKGIPRFHRHPGFTDIVLYPWNVINIWQCPAQKIEVTFCLRWFAIINIDPNISVRKSLQMLRSTVTPHQMIQMHDANFRMIPVTFYPSLVVPRWLPIPIRVVSRWKKHQWNDCTIYSHW